MSRSKRKIRGRDGQWLTAIHDAYGTSTWMYRDVKDLIHLLFEEDIHQKTIWGWTGWDWVDVVVRPSWDRVGVYKINYRVPRLLLRQQMRAHR